MADSVRASVQGLAAILLGAAIAVLAMAVLPTTVLGLAVVVLVGTLAAAWRGFGDMGGWVTIAAMFVLIAGSGGLVDYLVGYVLLTGVGAAIGVVVNIVLPPMPLAPGDRWIGTARAVLAEQLDDLARTLRADPPAGHDEWVARHHDIGYPIRTMSRVVSRADEARRANWRARPEHGRADRQVQHARALERLSLVVEDLGDLLADREHAQREEVALGPLLRPSAADAIASVAAMLRDGASNDAPPSRECVGRAHKSVEALAGLVVDRVREGAAEALTAAAVVTALREAVHSA